MSEIELSEEQIDAAEAFVRAFGHTRTSGGGSEVIIRLPDKPAITGLDGWKGVDAAVRSVATSLARHAAEQPYHGSWRALRDESR